MKNIEYIEIETCPGNQFCSHSSKFFIKTRYNREGKQIGTAYDAESKTFLRCFRSLCGAEFNIVQSEALEQ